MVQAQVRKNGAEDPKPSNGKASGENPKPPGEKTRDDDPMPAHDKAGGEEKLAVKIPPEQMAGLTQQKAGGKDPTPPPGKKGGLYKNKNWDP